MTKMMVLVCAFALVILSCEREQSTQDAHQIELKKDISLSRLTNSTIGFEKDGIIKFAVSDEKVISIFNKFAIDYELDFKSNSVKIINIESKNYLRFYDEKNQVATLELIKEDQNTFRTGSTVCKSTASASVGGFVPDGLYCTECILLGGLKGDCTSTTTGEIGTEG